MKRTLEDIQALQDLSERRAEIRRQVAAISARLDARQQMLQERERRAEQLHEQRLQAAKEADGKQLKIEEAEQEIERLKHQLNVTRHQKEYDVIQHSILSRTADVSRWEDEELTTLDAIDELAEQEKRTTAELDEVRTQLRNAREEAAAEIEECEGRLQEIEDQLARLRRDINADVLKAYDRLTPSHGNDALAPVKGHICQGCRTRVTKQTENLLMRGTEIVYCHSCGRMLMLAE
jgi:predicted  nucleic acid-binding Zn-ribbon protein